MTNYLTLTKILVKTSISSMMIESKKHAKLKTIAIYAILAVCMLPMIALIYTMVDSLYSSFAIFNQEKLILTFGFNIISFVIFVFSIFMVPMVYYFADDIETLLALPLKPHVIVAAKFTTTLIYEYATSFIMFLPLIIAYGNKQGFSFLFSIQSIIFALLLPIVPLLYATLLMVLVMRFSPFMKNKDTFNMIAGGLTLILAFSLNFFSSNMNNIDSEALVQTLINGDNAIVESLSNFFFHIRFFTVAIAQNDLLNFIVGSIIVIIIASIILLVSKYFYLNGVVGINESSKSKKQLSESEIKNVSKQNRVLLTYTKKEILLLLRTPIYFLNCIVSNFIWVGMVGISYFSINSNLSQDLDFDLSQVSNVLENIIDYTDNLIIAWIIIGSLAVGMFVGITNAIACTSISREGRQFFVMKYLPINYKTQLRAKALSSIIISFMGSGLMIILLGFFAKAPFYIIIFSLLISLIGNVFVAYLGVIIDVLKPKLSWEKEAVAVKQNLNSFIHMALGVAIIGLMIWLPLQIDLELIILFASINLIIILLLTWIIDFSLEKITIKSFSKR